MCCESLVRALVDWIELLGDLLFYLQVCNRGPDRSYQQKMGPAMGPGYLLAVEWTYYSFSCTEVQNVVKTNMKRKAGHCCQQVKSYMNSCIPVRRLAQTNVTETIPVARFHITPGERESQVLTNVYTHLWWQHSSTILLYMQYKLLDTRVGVSTIPCDSTELIRLTISTVISVYSHLILLKWICIG